MSFFQAIIIALFQGLTELFPVSSLGHAVIVPAILGWNFDQKSPQFLPFLVVLHIGTATALLLYFWRDWWSLGLAVMGRGKTPEDVTESRHLLVLLILGTVPAIVLGGLFEKILRELFGSPISAAIFLIVNGMVLFTGERLRRRKDAAKQGRKLAQAHWRDALFVGLFQAMALIPGISRSGTTIVGGLLTGLRHEDAARFSFLLATPVIVAAAALEVPKLIHDNGSSAAFSAGTLWISGIIAGVTAYASTAFLMRYFKAREENAALDPFAYYCWIAGAFTLLYLR